MTEKSECFRKAQSFKIDISKGSFLGLLLLIFRSSIVDGKENNQKVLSAKLLIKMNPDKSINLLRKKIVSGRLGKFEVVPFPDKFAGVVPIYCLFKFSF